MHNGFKKENTPFIIAVIFSVFLISYEFIEILIKNAGHFTYTLDDSYIHLALAEHIAHFHYGINASEFSAPSSSILWPFLLVPFMGLSWNSWIPLLLNIVATFITLFMAWKILVIAFKSAFSEKQSHVKLLLITFLLCLLIPATNMIGLIFLGMEHSWQVVATLGVLYAIVRDMDGEYSRGLFIVFIVLGVALRYENLLVSFIGLAYLFFSGYRRDAIIISLCIFLMVSTFSLFLMNLGLGPMPTSILIKTHHFHAAQQSFWQSFLHAITLFNASKLFLVFCFVLLASFSLFSKETQKKRWLSAGLALAILLHFNFGKFGWYGRYEIYIEIFSLMTLIYLFSPVLAKLFLRSKTGFVLGVILLELLSCQIYNKVLITIPQAANNIYEQQYQMHRFVVEYYKKPVLVNDIGYVAYQNIYGIIDLYGLGSIEAAKHHSDPVGTSPEWMNHLANDHHALLAIIYDSWFPVKPANWEKVAELTLSGEKITAARSTVSFYVLNKAEITPVKEELFAFQKTLPKQNVLTIY